MADVFTKEVRSELMSKIRGKNTKPEMLVRKFLFAQGFRYRIHKSDLPGRPDIVLKRYKVVIFVNGCFWHGHQNCRHFKMPSSRTEYWVPKIEKNIYKDREFAKQLETQGWRVLVIWGCQLKKNIIDETLTNLSREIRNTKG